MSTVYDEALLDAKKIRDVAERAARNKIMETITPQIREMINKRILSEQDDDLDFEDEDEEVTDDVETDEFAADTDDFDLAAVDDDQDYNLDSIVDSMPDIDGGYDDTTIDSAVEKAKSSVAVYAQGDVNINVDSDDDDMLGESASGFLAQLVNKDFRSSKKLESKIASLQERVRKLADVMSVLKENALTSQQKKRLELSFITCVKDAVSLQSEVKLSGRGSQHLRAKLNSTIKEMREMSSKYKKNIFDFLFEGDDAESKKKKAEDMNEQDETEDEVLDGDEDEEMELDDEEAAPTGDVDVDAATSALTDLGAALGLDLEIVGAEAEGDEDLDFDAEDMGEEDDEDVDLEEMAFGGMYEADDADDDLDEVYEIDEGVLRRELAKMRNGRKTRRVRESRRVRPSAARRNVRRNVREAAEDEADQFGGADILGDVIEVDEDTLINVLADELGSVTTRPKAPGAGSMAEARRRMAARRARANSRGPVRKAMREAAVYKRAANELKGQLVEMNLFNAKLLYANKLLQNKNLTVKQQRAIVEALDNAKTLREAKLLYKSLSESLTRRGRSGKNLSEGKMRTLGSSSRSTRSAQPSNNGVETDRWAVLAGISKG